MRQKRFEKSVIDGIHGVLDNPGNYIIDGGYYTGGAHLYQTEYYVFSRKDRNIVFSITPDSRGNILSIAENNVIISKDKFDQIFDLTHNAFKTRPQISNESGNQNQDNNPINFLGDFADKINSKWLNNANQNDYEQNLINVINSVLSSKQTIIYNGIEPNSSNHKAKFYVYSDFTKQRLYSVEYVPLLHDQYIVNINYQIQTLSMDTLKNVFDLTENKHRQRKKLSAPEEHQQFILQYLSDYANER